MTAPFSIGCLLLARFPKSEERISALDDEVEKGTDVISLPKKLTWIRAPHCPFGEH